MKRNGIDDTKTFLWVYFVEIFPRFRIFCIKGEYLNVKKNLVSMEYTLKSVLISTLIKTNISWNDISLKNKIRMFHLKLCSYKTWILLFLFQVAIQQNCLMYTNNYGHIDRQILQKKLKHSLLYQQKQKTQCIFKKKNHLYKHYKVNFVAK